MALSDEQKLNALKFGLCRVCREPLRPAMTDEMVDGKRVVTHSLVCPNGCDQLGHLQEPQSV